MWALLYCIVLYESAAIQHFFVNMKYKYILKYLFIIPCINTVHHLGILIESAKKILIHSNPQSYASVPVHLGDRNRYCYSKKNAHLNLHPAMIL